MLNTFYGEPKRANTMRERSELHLIKGDPTKGWFETNSAESGTAMERNCNVAKDEAEQWRARAVRRQAHHCVAENEAELQWSGTAMERTERCICGGRALERQHFGLKQMLTPTRAERAYIILRAQRAPKTNPKITMDANPMLPLRRI